MTYKKQFVTLTYNPETKALEGRVLKLKETEKAIYIAYPVRYHISSCSDESFWIPKTLLKFDRVNSCEVDDDLSSYNKDDNKMDILEGVSIPYWFYKSVKIK